MTSGESFNIERDAMQSTPQAGEPPLALEVSMSAEAAETAPAIPLSTPLGILGAMRRAAIAIKQAIEHQPEDKFAVEVTDPAVAQRFRTQIREVRAGGMEAVGGIYVAGIAHQPRLAARQPSPGPERSRPHSDDLPG
ncbi:MAG: hypothetical protein LBE08_12360 [Bifidobacteriaceae bacterium]|jgi:hypothetical protein|nr:hypothetical protein [Bifidobacteriaceae bacterium]